MRKLLTMLALGLALALAMAGCGQQAPATDPVSTAPTGDERPPTAEPAATMPPAPTAAPSPLVLPTVTPAPTQGPTQPAAVRGSDDPIVGTVRAALARNLGVEPGQLTLVTAVEREWSDSSLGCPAPDQAYMQVIVPGMLLVFSDGAQEYAVHTGRNAQQMVLCRDGRPTLLPAQAAQPAATRPVLAPPAVKITATPVSSGVSAGSPPVAPSRVPGAPLPAPMQQMLDMAIQRLAEALRIDQGEISLVLAEPVTWNDGSLGCPQPGMVYPQVLVDGYRFVLQAQGLQYELHTDTRRSVVLCPAVSPDGPPGGTGAN